MKKHQSKIILGVSIIFLLLGFMSEPTSKVLLYMGAGLGLFYICTLDSTKMI